MRFFDHQATARSRSLRLTMAFWLVVVLTVFLRPVKPAAPQPRSVQPPVPVAERSAL